MHHPVLYNEALDLLVTDPEGIYVDCTVGGGGHLKGILKRTGCRSLVIGIDQDPMALNEVSQNLGEIAANRVRLFRGNFRHLEQILKTFNLSEVQGVLLDLGVSSFQLDEEGRGFSYHGEAKLDMRMDPSQSVTAWQLINQLPEKELEHIIRNYGEEKFARPIARGIVSSRREQPIDTTFQLVEVIKKSVPYRYQRDKHPARRTFQALRIAVNDELGALQEVLPQAIDFLKPGGRISVITFHSLEDRMVKEFFVREAKACLCPPQQPICTCSHQARLKVLTKKPLAPSKNEISQNRRARSARLRAAEKIGSK